MSADFTCIKIGSLILSEQPLDITGRDAKIVKWSQDNFGPDSFLGALARQGQLSEVEMFVLRCACAGEVY